jgi:tetratricopeptide (TPR) repeat protein
MKRIFIIPIIMVLFGSLAYSQSAADKVRDLVKSKDWMEASAFIPSAVKDNPKDSKLITLCGDVYFEIEKLDSALIMYYKADNIEGDNIELIRKIAKTYSYLGRTDDAILTINRAIKKDKNNVYCLLDLGNIYLRADSISEATLIITRAREMNKSIPDAYVALGNLYFAQKVFELAKTNYEEALNIDPNLTEARIQLATAYYWLGMKESDKELSNQYLSRSLKEWSNVTQKDPKNAKAFYEQGKLYYFSKSYIEAAQSFYQYIILRPSGSLGRWYLAQSLYEIGQCDSAAQHLRIVAKEIDTVKEKSLTLLARCYYERSDYKNAVSVFNELIANKVSLDVKDLERFGSSYLKTGDTTNALNIYKQVIALDPTNCKLTFSLGQVMQSRKSFDDANYFFSLYIKNCQNEYTGRAYFYIGANMLTDKKIDTALIYLNKSAELDTAFILTQLYLGDAYAAAGNPDTSKIIFKKLIASKSGDTTETGRSYVTNAYSKLCGLIFEEKNYKELQKVGEQWVTYDPKSSYSYMYLAIAYQVQGETEAACKNYKKSLANDPKNKTAKDMLKKLNCE